MGGSIQTREQADKENAIDYFELTLPMLKVGGIVAADNIIHPDSCVLDMTKYATT